MYHLFLFLSYYEISHPSTLRTYTTKHLLNSDMVYWSREDSYIHICVLLLLLTRDRIPCYTILAIQNTPSDIDENFEQARTVELGTRSCYVSTEIHKQTKQQNQVFMVQNIVCPTKLLQQLASIFKMFTGHQY